MLPIQKENSSEKYLEFIDIAAHDLHAPLRKLSVLVDRLFSKYSQNLDENAKEYVDRIENCLSEMQLIITRLAELAKATVEEQPFTPCNLNSLVNGVLDTMKQATKGTDLHIHKGVLPIIHGNETQLAELFKNIFQNSVKFCAPGQVPMINITARLLSGGDVKSYLLPETNTYYEIGIQDNGIGFDAENAEKIFEPFVRLHPKSRYFGSGLGLAICKQIVSNHGGTIAAESKENAGTFIKVILPETLN